MPSLADEDRRQLHRALLPTKRARPRGLTRMPGLRVGCGIRLARQGEVEAQLEQARQGDHAALPTAVRARLQREWPQGQGLTAQIVRLEAERRAVLRTRAEPGVEQVRPWATRRGLGVKRAWLLVMAGVAWRAWRSSKPGGALAGLTPTP